MDRTGKTILVTGATGRQGGAVARHLLNDGWPVRALTRDPGKPAAQKLRELGAELVPGDLGVRASLDRALAGVYGVFGVQDSPPLRESIIEKGVLSMALKPDVPLQMIAVDDIGALAGMAFANPDAFIGKELELAGDGLTMPQAAEAFGNAIGRPVRFVEQPLEELRQSSEEFAVMFEWFNEHGYQADIPALRQIHPELMPFEAWLKKTGGPSIRDGRGHPVKGF